MCVTYRGGQYFIVFASDIENYSNFYSTLNYTGARSYQRLHSKMVPVYSKTKILIYLQLFVEILPSRGNTGCLRVKVATNSKRKYFVISG